MPNKAEPNTVEKEESWHLSKAVPITIVLTGFLYAFYSGSWTAALQSRVEGHDRQIAELKVSDQTQQEVIRKASEILARMDERLMAQSESLKRLERVIVPPSPRRD